MKISIKNFGPISSFTYDVSDDFVLIVGENNIGKSYAISVVYLVLKTFISGRRGLSHARQQSFLYADFDGERTVVRDGIPAWVREIEQGFKNGSLTADRDVTTDIKSDIAKMWQRVILPDLQDALYGTFNEVANLQNRFTQDPLELYVSDDSMGIKIGIDENNLIVKEVELKKKYFVRHVKQVRTIKETADAISIYCPDEKENQFQQNYMQAFYKIYGRLIRSANLSISDLHYLPASRSGLYQALGAFSQIVAELAKSRTLLSSRLVLPSIAIPLSDYFLKLSNLRPPPKTETSSVFASIAQSIEQSILRGKVDFDQKTKRLLFEPDGLQLSLDLSATSSMVSEISPIAAYFKYVLPRSDLMSGRGKSSDHKTKQIVIIEEPEAHLHPQLQAALVEVFAAMARTAGVKIIMTSHSNYVFNKASNLLIDESINAASFRAIVFKRQPTGGEGIDLICSDLGIEDDNFIDIGEELYEERIRLLKNKEDKKGVPHNSAT